jgi:predicted small integral membrane protein
MAKVSVLLDDMGNSHQPTAWEGAEPGGHHREGILKFDPITTKIKSLTLKIKDIGGISERAFQWSLNN